jgi:hypothetical protein
VTDAPHAPAPWDQYPGEPADAFQIFAFYRDLGIARTLVSCARAYLGAYSYGWIVQTSKAWAWPERAAAFDQWHTAQRSSQAALLIAEQNARWAEEQATQAVKLGTILDRELDRIAKDQNNGAPMRSATFARLLEIHHKHQQLATGGATEVVDNRLDLASLTDEQRAALEAARPALEQLAKG